MPFEKIIKSPALPVELPAGNFVKNIFKDVNKWLMKPAIECAETGAIYTYSELLDQIKQWSGFLKDYGLVSKDPIAIISHNCPQFIPIFFGTVSIGIPFSPMKPTLTSNEIRKLIFDIRSKLIVYSQDLEELVSQALKEDISRFQLFCIGKPVKLKALNVDDVLYGKEFIYSSWPLEINGKETALVTFSSGTTGHPKAVEISHNALSDNIYSSANPYHNLLWKPEDLDQSVIMGMVTFSHVSAMLYVLSLGIFSGCKIVVFSQFSEDAFIDGIRKYRITRMHTPPHLLNLMINSSKCTEETIQSLDTIIISAAPLLKSSVEAFRKKFKSDIELMEAYGLNETLTATMMPRKCKNLFGCGRLLSNASAKIICTKTGKTLGPNQMGEICIKSPSVMKGYLNNQTATKDILKNGWIHTGDIGYYDEDEFLFVTDRIKDLIKVDGFQVSPSEIEDELQKHPLVEECSVIGKPEEKHGELPFAFVVRKGKVSEEELKNFLKGKLADFKQLKGGVKFVESLPKSEILKTLKRELKSMI